MNAELLSNVAGPVHGIIWSLKCRWHNKVMGNALMDVDCPNFLNPTIQSQVVPWDCPLGLHTLCKTSSMCTGQCCMLDWRCAETQQHIDTHLIGARLVRALIRKNLEPEMEDLSHNWQTIANLSKNGHRHFLHFLTPWGPHHKFIMLSLQTTICKVPAPHKSNMLCFSSVRLDRHRKFVIRSCCCNILPLPLQPLLLCAVCAPINARATQLCAPINAGSCCYSECTFKTNINPKGVNVTISFPQCIIVWSIRPTKLYNPMWLWQCNAIQHKCRIDAFVT